MFDSKTSKYMTVGIANEVPIHLQYLMWGMIEKLKSTIELDYLQVFILNSLDNDVIRVEHQQEVPKYKEISYLSYECEKKYDNTKIFVIDDGNVLTMLLAEEY